MIANRKGVELIPAFSCVRMSRIEQDKSPEQQRSELETLAATYGCVIAQEYSDEGISGANTRKRKGFLQMLHDVVQPGAPKIILSWDQDRFSRLDSIDSGEIVAPLRRAGVRLITVAQGEIDWNTFAGRLIFNVQQEGKNQFLHDVARNSLRGQIAKARQGLWVGGSAPYGYRIGDDKHLELDDSAEVKVVREIFRIRLLKMGYRGIARILNERGIPAPGGGKWSHDGVRIILTREYYTGTYVFGGRAQGKFFTTHEGQPTPTVKGRRTEPIRVENAHPAIIDAKTFERCQEIARLHPKPFCRAGNEGAPLAGLLFCGRCGSPMYSQSLARKAGQRFPNYVCGSYHKGHGCGYCFVPQDAVLNVIANVIKEKVLLGGQERLEAAVRAELARRETRTAERDSVALLKRQAAALDQKIANATDRLVSVSTALVPAIEKKLLDLQAERRVITLRMKATAKPTTRPDAKKIASKLWELDTVLRNGGPAKVRAALSEIVDRVTLDFEPAEPNGRGQRFSFVKGTVALCTKQCARPESCP